MELWGNDNGFGSRSAGRNGRGVRGKTNAGSRLLHDFGKTGSRAVCFSRCASSRTEKLSKSANIDSASRSPVLLRTTRSGVLLRGVLGISFSLDQRTRSPSSLVQMKSANHYGLGILNKICMVARVSRIELDPAASQGALPPAPHRIDKCVVMATWFELCS